MRVFKWLEPFGIKKAIQRTAAHVSEFRAATHGDVGPRVAVRMPLQRSAVGVR
jgi:hypothetical protein